MNRLIERIEQRRTEMGMTQKELLKRTGIPEATYRNYLAGRTERMSFPTARILSLALKIPLDELAACISDELPSEMMEIIETINNTPATTKEVDSAITVLIRTIESVNASHAAALHMLEDEFKQVIAERNRQFEQLIAAQDERHRRELSSLLTSIQSKDRWIRALFISCCSLSLCICAALFLIGLHFH